MSVELDKAIEALTSELNDIAQRAIEVKKAINQLYALKGEAPPYDDVEFSPVARSLTIAPDQFFGRGFAPAVKQFLKMKGRATLAQEILDALTKGGFEFPKSWDKKLWLKNVAISLSKNRNDFVPVPTSNGTAYGLHEFYPEKMKGREKKPGNNQRRKTLAEITAEEESVADLPEPGSPEETFADDTIDGDPSSLEEQAE